MRFLLIVLMSLLLFGCQLSGGDGDGDGDGDRVEDRDRDEVSEVDQLKLEVLDRANECGVRTQYEDNIKRQEQTLNSDAFIKTLKRMKKLLQTKC